MMSFTDPLADLAVVMQRAVEFLPTYEAYGVIRSVCRTCRDAVHDVGVNSTGEHPALTLTRVGHVRWRDGRILKPRWTYTRGVGRRWTHRVHTKSTGHAYVIVGRNKVFVRNPASGVRSTTMVVKVWDRRAPGVRGRVRGDTAGSRKRTRTQ